MDNNFLDFAAERTRVLVFEDTEQQLTDILRAMAGTDCEILVWDALGKPPTVWADVSGSETDVDAFVGVQRKLGYAPDWQPITGRNGWQGWLVRCVPAEQTLAATSPVTLERFIDGAGAVVVDLGLATASRTEACQKACCTGQETLEGFHVLRQAEAAQCLHKVLVSSGKLDYVLQVGELRDELKGFLSKGLSIFSKAEPAELVANKIRAWVRFDDLGYYADHRTRDALYMVGRRGPSGDVVSPEHVLIVGASGTGKEQAARFIHFVGNDFDDRYFTAVACGGLIDAAFAKSQLFGHTRGAYTDASTHRFGVLLTALGCRPEPGDVKRGRVERDEVIAGIWELQKGVQAVEHRIRQTEPSQRSSEEQLQLLAAGLEQLSEILLKYARGEFREVSRLLRQFGKQAGVIDPSEDYVKWALSSEENSCILEEDGHGSLRVRPEAPMATVFLDEFQDLPPDVQALLLRVIEQGEVEPLGFNGLISLKDRHGRLHLRVIGTTNDPRVRASALREPRESEVDVELARHPGSTRQSVRDDLVMRLSQWVVTLPDVSPDEVRFLIDREKEDRRLFVEWDSTAVDSLMVKILNEPFPGNRRQVRQVICRAMALVRHERTAGTSLGRPDKVMPEDVRKADEPISPSVGSRKPGNPTPFKGPSGDRVLTGAKGTHTSVDTGAMLAEAIRTGATQLNPGLGRNALAPKEALAAWVRHAVECGQLRLDHTQDLLAFFHAAIHHAWNLLDADGAPWLTQGLKANRGRTEQMLAKGCVEGAGRQRPDVVV